MTAKEQIELRNKIMKGLDLSYQRLLETKRRNGEDLIIMRNNQIVRVKP